LTEQRFRYPTVRVIRASIDDCDGYLRLHAPLLRRSFYVGSATGDDLSRRIDQHNAGYYPGYTFTRRPIVLVWSEHFDRITDGIAAERQIKGWSRAKKEALIRSDWAAISRLARLGQDTKGSSLIKGPGMTALGSTKPVHRHPEVRAQRASKDELHGRWPFILRDARSALLRMTDRQSAPV
jgi:putative endonuclease